MEPFHHIVPEANDPVMTLVLDKKTGSIPKGRYGFLEYYCTEPGCDCRRALLLVFNDKQKCKAVINFGFDQQGAMDGPYLDTSNKQSPYAFELLQFFVHSLNNNPQWLERMYRQYRQVREAVEGKPYRGKAFPKPGKLQYHAHQPPDLEAEIAESLRRLAAPSNPGAHAVKQRKGVKSAAASRAKSGPAAAGIPYFVDRYADLGICGPINRLLALRAQLGEYLLENETASEELARLLPDLYREEPEGEKLQAAMMLLYDVLDFWRMEIEDRQPGAERQMERLQEALARFVYLEGESPELCAIVTSKLVNSGVEVLPVLRQANSRMIAEAADRFPIPDTAGEEVLSGIARSIEAMGITSPFEGVQELLELFMLNEAELQLAIVRELLNADNVLLREIAALMLFSPDAEVRLGVSRLLAAVEGRLITADTLRRLIVSRNWFAEEIRKNIDQAVSNARKARIECAPLPKSPAMTVHASPLDGSGAQSFQVVVPDGKGYLSCSILLKQGVGVTDAFVVALKGKREHKQFLEMLGREGFFRESTPEYLDRRICHTLADGVRTGEAPNHWLVQIAELLGRDRWNAAPLDAAAELEQMRERLAAKHPLLVSEMEYVSAMEESGEWHDFDPVFGSWFEDDDLVIREIEASRGDRKSIAASAAIKRILALLEERRQVWLERLLLVALWVESGKRVPFSANRLYHVACAVANRDIALKDIPLMHNVAHLTYRVFEERKKESRQRFGVKK